MAQLASATMWNNSKTSFHNISRRHASYISKGDVLSCHLLYAMSTNSEAACKFIKKTANCNDMVSSINYLKFLICVGKINGSLWGLTQLFIIFVAIIIFLATFMFLITKYFILRNVIHVAHYMRMPIYYFGLTIFSLIVSAPQITWIIQECDSISSNGTLMLANMMGATLTTYIFGLSVVCFGKHTKIPGREFVVHIIVCIIVLASSYLTIVNKLEDIYDSSAEEITMDLRPIALFCVIFYACFLLFLITTKRRRSRHSSAHTKLHHNLFVAENYNGWSQLWHALNPFEHMKASRYVIAVLAPIWVIAALQIPVIDKERQMFGWCKYLTCLNIFIFPWIVFFAKLKMFSFIVSAFLCVVLFIITIFFTNTNEPPKYQGVYAVIGIFFGFYIYYIIQRELETILWQAFSFIFNTPRDIIMLTGYVFHNVINLVIFCYELVTVGFGNLACGVIVGVVMNKIFLMLPILTFNVCNDYEEYVAPSANTSTCFAFTILTFLLSIIFFSATNFELRVSQGIFLITIYVIFLLFIALSGYSLIHPYGGIHTLSLYFQKHYADWA